MNELERELRLLGGTIAWPDVPDLALTVRARIEKSPARRLPWWRRKPIAAVALALLVAAVAAVMAVPSARTAILRALGIGSVRIELVDELPPVRPRSDLVGLGDVVTLDEARAGFPYPLLVPDTGLLGSYDEVLLAGAPEPQVSFVWYDRSGDVRLLVSILPGNFVGGRYVKLIGPGTRVEEWIVDGRRTLWITGEAHGFGLESPGGSRFEEVRLAGNTLLVDHGRTTIRIEGDLSRERANKVAAAMKPS